MNKLTIRSLVAAAVASLALVAVGPASAEQKHPPSTDGKKYCLFNADPNQSYDSWYQHGTSMTITGPDGRKRTFRCNDGKWEEVKKMTTGGAVINLGTGTLTVSDGGGTLVLTQPKIDSGAYTPGINLGIAP